jgi:hypothetical protein
MNPSSLITDPESLILGSLILGSLILESLNQPSRLEDSIQDSIQDQRSTDSDSAISDSGSVIQDQ